MTFKPLLLATLALVATPAFAQDCGAGLRTVSHDGGVACVPEVPERIVSLHDGQVTTVLYELGAPVVGSAGSARWAEGDDSVYLRGMVELYGFDFADTGIAFIGDPHEPDLEAIAALAPDLIVGWDGIDPALIDRMTAIAPVVIVGGGLRGLDASRTIAEAAGRTAEWDRLNAAYQATVAAHRAIWPDAGETTFDMLYAWQGGYMAVNDLGALSVALADLGLVPATVTADLNARAVEFGEERSLETADAFDGDLLITFYESAGAEMPDNDLADMEAMVPGWCDRVPACAADRVIPVQWEQAYGYSFRQLDLMVRLLTAHGTRPVN